MATSERISQKTLAAILNRRAKVAAAQAELEKLENDLLEKLKAGTAVQAGLYRAALKSWERRSVAWKQVVVRELGQSYADRVFNATQPEHYEALVVEIAD